MNTRSHTYCFIKDEKIEMILTNKQIFEKYGIKNMTRMILLDPEPIIDGYLVIECSKNEEHFKKIYGNVNFEYYVSSMGYIMEVSKQERRRSMLDVQFDRENNIAYSVTSDGKKFNIADKVARKFLESLPDRYSIIYLDGNPEHCCLDNLFVLPEQKRNKMSLLPSS